MAAILSGRLRTSRHECKVTGGFCRVLIHKAIPLSSLKDYLHTLSCLLIVYQEGIISLEGAALILQGRQCRRSNADNSVQGASRDPQLQRVLSEIVKFAYMCCL